MLSIQISIFALGPGLVMKGLSGRVLILLYSDAIQFVWLNFCRQPRYLAALLNLSIHGLILSPGFKHQNCPQALG